MTPLSLAHTTDCCLSQGDHRNCCHLFFSFLVSPMMVLPNSTYIYLYTYMCICICVHIYYIYNIYTHILIYIYIWMYCNGLIFVCFLELIVFKVKPNVYTAKWGRKMSDGNRYLPSSVSQFFHDSMLWVSS